MISIKHINKKDIDLCYELDSNTISLWSKKQWANEFKKEGIKVYGVSLSDLIIGIIFLLGLSKSIFCFKKDCFSSMGELQVKLCQNCHIL